MMRWLVLAAIGVVLAIAVLARPSKSETPACTQPDTGVLQEWARTGFSDPEPKIPHVLGDKGQIVAILFGSLEAPPGPNTGDKVLWVAKDPVDGLSDLEITAQRIEDGKPVGKPERRTVAGGPGPSGIDMPEPGCWRMSLRWSGRTDRLELRYTKPQ
jgi:hypothetical protein